MYLYNYIIIRTELHCTKSENQCLIMYFSAHFQKLNSIYFARNDEDPKDERSFAADFTITLGTHKSGADLLDPLIEEKCRVSTWSMQALENPDFPVVSEKITVDIVVVSMLEMGFAEGEFATLETIYDRARATAFRSWGRHPGI